MQTTVLVHGITTCMLLFVITHNITTCTSYNFFYISPYPANVENMVSS